MTDTLLQQLEEKMMTLLAELENLRKETTRLTQENNALKMEYGNQVKRLQNLVSLLDSLNSPQANNMHAERYCTDEAAEHAVV